MYFPVVVDSLAKNEEIRRLYQGSRDKILGMEFSISPTIPTTPEAPDPHFVMKPPLLLNFCTRSLPVSISFFQNVKIIETIS